MPDPNAFSDEELVVWTRTKDKQFFAELVRRYQDKLMRYAMYMLHDRPKATDAVQDAFIKAYVNLNGFDTRKKFSSWIYRIVHNEAINHTKKYAKEMPLLQGADAESDDGPEEEFTRKELARRARRCLGQLPVSYSEPLELYYLEEKSYEEISDILRMPMGTVATRISRAKGMMKRICKRNA